MPKRVTKGNGITSRQEMAWELNEPAEWADHLQFLAKKEALETQYGNEFEYKIHQAEAWANSILVGKTLPYADDSKEDFAHRISTLIQITRRATEGRNPVSAAKWGMELGALIKEAETKIHWEAHALRGKKSPVSGRKGFEEVYGTDEEREAKYAQWQRRINEHHEEVKDDPRRNWTWIQEKVAAEFGCSTRTIRNHCRNPYRKK